MPGYDPVNELGFGWGIEGAAADVLIGAGAVVEVYAVEALYVDGALGAGDGWPYCGYAEELSIAGTTFDPYPPPPSV